MTLEELMDLLPDVQLVAGDILWRDSGKVMHLGNVVQGNVMLSGDGAVTVRAVAAKAAAEAKVAAEAKAAAEADTPVVPEPVLPVATAPASKPAAKTFGRPKLADALG